MKEPIVDWTLLPHQPVRFFGLGGQFDRRDLKRAYGKLIRTFKPETHPNEFQRIRRAYEQLENQVRYGLQQEAMNHQANAWNLSTDSTRETNSDQTLQPTAPAPEATQTAVANPTATYQQLRQNQVKSPQDFFFLAVVSDIVSGGDANSFLKWLLQGLQQHPHDAGLQQLLREYLRTDIDLKLAPAVLQSCAKSLPGDVFYRLTEPLWDRIIRDTPFPKFAKLLAACEKLVKHKEGMARVTFCLRMLRVALWKANKQWIETAFKIIQSHGTELDGAAEHELEFLFLVRDYLQHDRGNLEDSPIRTQLDKMIRSYCEDDWDVALGVIVRTQDELARNSLGMIDAFPVDVDTDDFRLLSLCMMITSEAAQQSEAEHQASGGKKSERQSMATLSDLRDSLGPVIQKVTWQRRRTYVPPFVAIVIIAPLLLFSGFQATVFVLCLTAWALISVAGYYLLLKPKFLDPRADNKTSEVLLQAYRNNWRKRLFRYVQSTGEAPQAAVDRLQDDARATGASEWMNVVLSHIQLDAALIMFGQAQRFVT